MQGRDERATDFDRLRTRVCFLEEALARISRELEPALECPEVSFVALHRVACLARRSLADR
jgi:hypothetical protein